MVYGYVCIERIRKQLLRFLDPVLKFVQFPCMRHVDCASKNDGPQFLPAWIFSSYALECHANIVRIIVRSNAAVDGLHQRLQVVGILLQLRFQQIHVPFLLFLCRFRTEPHIAVVMKNCFPQAMNLKIAVVVPHLVNSPAISRPGGHPYHADCHKITVGPDQVRRPIIANDDPTEIIPLCIRIF